MTTPTPEDDVKQLRDALADYSKWAGRPTVLENAIALIEAQAVRLEAADRDLARRMQPISDLEAFAIWEAAGRDCAEVDEHVRLRAAKPVVKAIINAHREAIASEAGK